ncbi:MAG: histidinol dehydrogenase [Desulfatibacillum sp.]|nr:histidinol dehydrogenase [Desulfatibacillum sp.]
MKIYQYPSQTAEKRFASLVDRGVSFRTKDVKAVTKILDDVRKNGDQAVVDYSNRFDAGGMSVESMRVTDEEMETALAQVEPDFQKAMERAHRNVADFHRRQLPKSWITTDRPGTVLGQMIRPVDAAGVYVPGGQGGSTPLVSSVIMGGVPAKIAGVERICMVTPPRADGTVHPYLLAAAKLTGIDEVFKIGSAWAIAAMAYGTESIKAVDVIVGPGNIYVTIAKSLVAGTVGIDMIAGPSEVLVIADHTANPDCVAADLLSQAEHDPMASSILVTTKKKIALDTRKALFERIAKLSRREIAEASVKKNCMAFVVDNLDIAADLANAIAPEHLELLVEDPFAYFPKIKHAGAMFLGQYTPEPVGDYVAGPNHVLPTQGTGRFSSALNVDNFLKKTSLLYYSKETFEEEAPDIIRLAEVEGLTAHAESVRARLKK